MDKIKINWKKYVPTRRRLIQLYAALLYNANLKGFAEGQIYTGGTKKFCVPGLNCYSCPGAVGACPLGSLQNALASSNNRAPYYIIGLFMLFGLTLGRLICGFLCPFGLLQELLHKIRTPKLRKSRWTHLLSYLKYVILVILVVWIPLVYSVQSFPVPAFCKYICPAGTLEGAIGLLANPVNADKFSMLGILFTRKFVILLLVLAACIFCYRAFCRFLCPLGAIYGFFCRIALLGVKLDRDLCTDCGLCVRSCKLDIRHVGDHECIQCGECMQVCPVKAISWKGGKVFCQERAGSKAEGTEQTRKNGGKKGPNWRAAAAWAAAAVVLAGVLWYYNRPQAGQPLSVGEPESESTATGEPENESAATGEPDSESTATGEPESESAATGEPENESAATRESENESTATGESEGTATGADKSENSSEEAASDWKESRETGESAKIPVGKDVGMKCPDFTVPQYDGGTFCLEDTRGKIVVINFWATWCTPCCNELPYFQQLADSYPDDVALIAIHSSLVTDDVQAYLDQMGYDMTFGLDETGDVIAALGGSTMLPMTVILDQNGIIVYNQVGSVTYQFLEAQITALTDDK